MVAEWNSDLENLFRHRVSRMLIGDALICKETGWRVDCTFDEKKIHEKLFIIQFDENVVNRKRPESVVSYLLANNAPRTLEYAQEGAIHLFSERLDGIDFLGWSPLTEQEPSGRINLTQKYGFVRIRTKLFNWFNMQQSHKTLRFCIEVGQATWFG